MKTSEQIIQWLKDQRIYDKFTANYNRGVQHRMSVGVYLKRTAPAYWFNINNNFLKWLNNEKDNVQ